MRKIKLLAINFLSIVISNVIYANVISNTYTVGYSELKLINQESCPSNFLSPSNEEAFNVKNEKFCNEIQLAIYYPSNQKCKSPYPALKTVIDDLKEIKPDLSKKEISKIKSLDVEICKGAAIDEKKFPVILFSPGYGLPAQLYTYTLSELTKNGFIVIGINSQFINGELQFSKTLSNVIAPQNEKEKKQLFINSYNDLNYVYNAILNNKLPGVISQHINKNEIGAVGHSLGSRSVAKIGHKKNICGIAAEDLTIDLIDGNDCHENLTKPFMHLFSSELYKKNKDFPYLCKENLHKLFKKIIIIGSDPDKNFSKHLNFSDYSLLQENDAIKPFLKNIKNAPDFFLGHGNGQAITMQINSSLINFFLQNCSQHLFAERHH